MCRKKWRLNRSRKEMINLIRNERWEKGFCEGNKGKKVGMRERERVMNRIKTEKND